jgi:hypothetical protein
MQACPVFLTITRASILSVFDVRVLFMDPIKQQTAFLSKEIFIYFSGVENHGSDGEITDPLYPCYFCLSLID